MRECKGVVRGFSWLGATCWRFCRKTQKEPAKCLYSVLYTVYSVLLSPLWLKSVPGWPAISVSTWQQSRVGQIVWFGWLSAISQLASRVGEGGGVWQLCLHSATQPYTTWPRWRYQGGGLCSLPLGGTHSVVSIIILWGVCMLTDPTRAWLDRIYPQDHRLWCMEEGLPVKYMKGRWLTLDKMHTCLKINNALYLNNTFHCT